MEVCHRGRKDRFHDPICWSQFIANHLMNDQSTRKCNLRGW
jgi:hypothetical protein